MKKIIYILLGAITFLAGSCKREIIDVRDFGRIEIDSISPVGGPSGSYTTVYGKNLSYVAADVKVTINQAEAQVIESSLTRMVVYIPQGATTGTLHINFNRKNPTNEQFDYSNQVQSYAESPVFTVNESQLPMPFLKSVSPRNGKAGDRILIKGYNFSAAGNCRVLFGNSTAETVSITPTELLVKVPTVVTPEKVALHVQQGNYVINADSFQLEETPEGIREAYFANWGSAQIVKAVFDDMGNPVMQVLYDASDGLTSPNYGVQVDAANKFIYWLDGSAVMKGSTDGSMAPVTLYTDPVFLTGISLDVAAGKLYLAAWSSSVSGSHSIKRINTDGSGTMEEVYQLPNEPMPITVLVHPASGKLYWIDGLANQIMEGNTNGQAARVLFDASDGFSVVGNFAISPSASRIFIVDNGNTAIYSGALDGSGTLTRLPLSNTELGNSPSDIVADDASQVIYWISPDYEDGRILRCKPDGSDFQRITGGLKNIDYFDLVF